MLCQSFIRFQHMRVVMQNSHDEQQYDKHASRQAGYTKGRTILTGAWNERPSRIICVARKVSSREITKMAHNIMTMIVILSKIL